MRHSIAKVNQTDIDKIVDKYQNYMMNSRMVNRKKTSLLKAIRFNKVISINLKVHGDFTFFLWCRDEATRLIRGKVIHDNPKDDN